MSTRPRHLLGVASGPTAASASFVGGVLPLREVGIMQDSLADAVNDGVREGIGDVPLFYVAFQVFAPPAAKAPAQHAVPT